jgi:hypothetical protein
LPIQIIQAKMEECLRYYIRTHGFRVVQETLTALAMEYRAFYEEELAFLTGAEQFLHTPSTLQVPPTPQPTPLIVPITVNEFVEPTPEVKVVQITAPAAAKAEEVMDSKEFTLEPSAVLEGKKHKMKVIRKGNRVIHVPSVQLQNTELVVEEEPVQPAPPAEPLIVSEEPLQQEQPQPKRTPAEVKKWQREQEAARKAFMKVNKISRSSLMTVENVRKWLAEGHTYARISREQLGCKEEEVSKFAKEHGLAKKPRA